MLPFAKSAIASDVDRINNLLLKNHMELIFLSLQYLTIYDDYL